MSLARVDQQRGGFDYLTVLAHIPGDKALDLLREQLNVPGATLGELAMFGEVCRALDLNPWAGQIVLIGRRVKGKLIHRHQVTVDGRRTIASRTGRLVAIEGPFWCGPRLFAPTGEKLPLEWEDVWFGDMDDPPYAARCFVYTTASGSRPAANGTVKWQEFRQEIRTDQGEYVLTSMWKQYPSHMLGKVAESLALRRGFPEVQDAIASAGPSWAEDDEDRAAIDEAEATAVTVAPTNVAGAPARPASSTDAGPASSAPPAGGPPSPAARRATSQPSPAGSVQGAPAPGAGRGAGAAAPGSRRPVERRHQRDEPPADYYDSLPEAQLPGQRPVEAERPVEDAPEDAGRPFE